MELRVRVPAEDKYIPSSARRSDSDSGFHMMTSWSMGSQTTACGLLLRLRRQVRDEAKPMVRRRTRALFAEARASGVAAAVVGFTSSCRAPFKLKRSWGEQGHQFVSGSEAAPRSSPTACWTA